MVGARSQGLMRVVISHSRALPPARSLATASTALLRHRGRLVDLAPAVLCRRTFSTSPDQRNDQAVQDAKAEKVDLLEVYREQVAQGRLQWDDEQVRCVMKLRHLLNTLLDYSPPLDLLAKLTSTAPAQAKRARAAWAEKSWWDRKGKAKAESALGLADRPSEAEMSLVRVLSGEEELANLRTPKGIMITGPPGTGKSQVLSLFYDLLPTTHKARWHYHAFTLHLYRQVFLEMERRRVSAPKKRKVENMEKAAKKGWRSVFAGGRWEDGEETDDYEREETIPFVIARDMILNYHILYFDEMQLVDASSAALLRDVLSWYWRLGGVIVTCSNRVPDDLYHHGVQKDRMASFLTALKARCEVVELDGGKDWRTNDEDKQLAIKWFNDDSSGFDESWREAIAGQNVAPSVIGVYGRKLKIPAAAGGACKMTFEDLCEQPLGAADYISLASTFSTIFIEAVPVLLLKNKNEARRLINLVDALYEARCQVYISAAAPVSALFFPDAITTTTDNEGIPSTQSFDHGDSNESIMAAEALSETLHAAAHPNVSLYNPGERTAREKREEGDARGASAFSVLGIWTGEDERFAYKRAVSRLIEMTTSPRYAKETWIPLDSQGRAWETSAEKSSSAYRFKPQGRPDQIKKPREGADDLATEAGYSRPGLLQTPARETTSDEPAIDHGGPRDNAPRIAEQHMWGVEEGWGKKAGKWGRGAKVFESSDPPPKGK